MRFIISGKNIDVTEGLRSNIEQKLGKLERYFTPETEIIVTLSVEKERQKIEVTIPIKGNIIRSEQESDDMYVSIDLVEEIHKIEGLDRIRLGSLDPRVVTEEVARRLAALPKVCPHFHLSLQSGCDATLRRMNRKYTTEEYKTACNLLREAFDTPALTTDVIVGFPGETDELFMETYNFLKDVVKPAFIHIFPYSRRAGTPAAERKDQVQDSIKTQRVQMLEELSATLHQEFLEANKGVAEKVLFESTDKNGMMEGYTGNYIRVERPYDRSKIGEIVEETI